MDASARNGSGGDASGLNMPSMDVSSLDEPKIRVAYLTKKFGELLVLDQIDFSIRKGELVSIVGSTGCGKTTFLNCRSKLMEPTSGNILIDGEVANPQKHNISFVVQEPTAMPWRTVMRERLALMDAAGGESVYAREQREAAEFFTSIGRFSPAELDRFNKSGLVVDTFVRRVKTGR